MAIDQESFNSRLYELLKVRGYKPVPKNSKNERSNPEQADVFEFTFTKDGQDYGKAWATIDQASQLKLYYDEEQAGSPPGKTPGLDYDDSWSGLLKHLKQWTLSKQLDFDLQDSDRLGDDMRQRDYYKMKERMDEGYHAVNKTTSYSDNIPNVKVVIQHDRQVQEGEQRWRNVHKIFVENTEGERFLVPTKRPGIARVYGRHVAEGGTPYDERGKHITQLVEEYTKMAGFIRATRNGEFTESVAQLVSEGVKHHKSLKETLQKMQSHRGYNHYFESWTPALMEDEHDPSIAEMFSHETIDPRIESVLPILNKLNKNIVAEMSEVNELEAWAQEITEGAEGCACCGCKTKAECTCPKDCDKCDCHKVDETKMQSFPGFNPGRHKTLTKLQKGYKDKKQALHDLEIDPEDAENPEVNKMIKKAFARIHQKPSTDLHEDEGLLSNAEIKDKVQRFLADVSKDGGDYQRIIKEKIKWLKKEAAKTKDPVRRTNFGKEARMLMDFVKSGEIPDSGAASAHDSAVADAKSKLQKKKDGRGPDKDHVTVGKALAGILGAFGGAPWGAGLAEDQLDEFMSPGGPDDNRPKKGKLVDAETGEEINLPATVKDFRGDDVEVVDFTAPHKPGSTGRIHTKDGMSYFPGVINAKIIDHDFDNLDEDLDANQKRAGQLGPTGGPAKVGDLVGANESVDPYAEGSWIGDADRIYHVDGEDALAEFLELTPKQLDQLVNEKGDELGMHPDDDRDEIMFRVVQDIDDNRDVKDYGSAMREESEKALADLKRFL